MATWTLQREADKPWTSKQVSSAWVSRLVRTLRRSARGTLELTVAKAMDASAPFVWGEWLTLARDESPWFAGLVTSILPSAKGAAEAWDIEVSDPWWYLENLVYLQTRTWITDATFAITLPHPWTGDPYTPEQQAANDAAILDGSAYPSRQVATSALLLRNSDAGLLLDTSADVSAAIAYAIAKGARLALGTVGAGVGLPRETIQDATVAEVISRNLNWTPDLAGIFDFSTSPPTLNFADLASRPTLSIDIADAEVSELGFVAREDIRIPGVTLNFIKKHTRKTSSGDLEFWTLDQDTAGADLDKPRALHATIELYGGAMLDSTGATISTGEPVPTGIAARLFAAWGALQYEGSIQLKQAECPSGSYLGRKLRVLGGNAAWATMDAEIHTQRDDVLAATTEMETGPADRLGPADLVELLRASRGLSPASQSAVNSATTGTTTSPTQSNIAAPSDGTENPGDGTDHPIEDYLKGFTYQENASTGIVPESSGLWYPRPPEFDAGGHWEPSPPSSVDGSPPPLYNWTEPLPVMTTGQFVYSVSLYRGLVVRTYDAWGVSRHASGYRTRGQLDFSSVPPNSKVFFVCTDSYRLGSTTIYHEIVGAAGSVVDMTPPYPSLERNPDTGPSTSYSWRGLLTITAIRVVPASTGS